MNKEHIWYAFPSNSGLLFENQKHVLKIESVIKYNYRTTEKSGSQPRKSTYDEQTPKLKKIS